VCQIVAQDFGLPWIELRGMWNKNITELTNKELQDAKKILQQHKLRVTDIASPLFKTDWPGAPALPAKRNAGPVFTPTLMPLLRTNSWTTVSLWQNSSTPIVFAASIFGGWMTQKPYRAAIDSKTAASRANAAPKII